MKLLHQSMILLMELVLGWVLLLGLELAMLLV
jgi:hypothetical protein